MLLNRHVLGLIILSGYLASCSMLGIPAADTFNKKWAAAQQMDTAVLQSALTLAQNGKISPDQLKKVEVQTDNAVAGLDLAKQLHATNPTAGSTRLDQIAAVLLALQSALASPDPGVALKAVPSPTTNQ